MKERELRKLGRLELLEMLLDATKENRELKEQVAKLKTENEMANGVENLSEAVRQINETISEAKALVDDLKRVDKTDEKSDDKPVVVSRQKEVTAPAERRKRVSDKILYYRILDYYAKNMELTEQLPDDLKAAVTGKLRSICDSSDD